IYFIYHERGDFNIWSVPAAGGVATRVTAQEGAIRSFETDAKADAFVFIHPTPSRSGDVEYLPAIGGPVRRLTRFSEDWVGLQEPKEIYYRSFDGLYIQGFLYLPSDFTPTRRYPALVNVHGGGTNSYLRTQSLMEQYFASKGYVVLAINYRGGSG